MNPLAVIWNSLILIQKTAGSRENICTRDDFEEIMCKRLDLSHMFISLLFKSIYTKNFGVINKQIYNSWYETSLITPLVQLLLRKTNVSR